MNNTHDKIWSNVELEAYERTIHKILAENNWRCGHRFRSREPVFIKEINTEVLKNSIKLSYTIIYYVGNDRTEKTLIKCFEPNNVMSIYNYIDDIELWMQVNTGRLNKEESFEILLNN